MATSRKKKSTKTTAPAVTETAPTSEEAEVVTPTEETAEVEAGSDEPATETVADAAPTTEETEKVVEPVVEKTEAEDTVIEPAPAPAVVPPAPVKHKTDLEKKLDEYKKYCTPILGKDALAAKVKLLSDIIHGVIRTGGRREINTLYQFCKANNAKHGVLAPTVFLGGIDHIRNDRDRHRIGLLYGAIVMAIGNLSRQNKRIINLEQLRAAIDNETIVNFFANK